MKLNRKGITEIVSYVFVILIIVIVVGIFVRAIIPIIEEDQEKANFQKAQNYIIEIEDSIVDILSKPVNTTKQIHLNLKDLSLHIDSNNDKIKIVQNIKYDIFKENFTQSIDSRKYNYRENQELFSVLDFNSVDIIRSRDLENKNITLYIKKVGKSTINISLSKEDEDPWYGIEFSNSSFSYTNTDQEGQWYYRKSITLDNNKIEGDLNSFPILVDLNADEDLYNYADENGSDILFTNNSGEKLHREIEVFDKYTIYRKKITIDHTKVDGDLTNFPILINITDSDLSTYSNEFGSDIYFEDSDGNRLKREIEDFNKETGDLTVWVKIPELLNSEDTDLYMYFGNPYAGGENSTEVWDEDYKMVQHLNNNLEDSTSYNNDGILHNSPSFLVMDNRLVLDLNNMKWQYGSIDHSSSLDINNEITVEAFVYFSFLDYVDNEGLLQTIFRKGHPDKIGPNFGWWLRYDNRSNKDRFPYTCFGNTEGGYAGGGNNFGNSEFDQIFDINQYYNISFSIKNSQGKLYINGNQKGYTKSFSDLNLFTNQNLIIGNPFNGKIDELRISNIQRSNSWISTEYNNQNDPSSFYNIENKEKIGDYAKLTAWVNIPQIRKDQDNSLYMYFGNDLASETNSNKVWNKNYILVQHLNESPDNDQANGFLDSTKYENNGTAYSFNNTRKSPPGVPCKLGTGSVFDGSNDYIEIGNFEESEFDVNDNFSVSAWINMHSISKIEEIKNRIGVFAKAGCYGIEYIIDDVEDNSIAASIRWAFGNRATYPYTNTYEWHKITMVYKGNNQTELYIDGILKDYIDNTTNDPFQNKTNNLYIGKNSASTGGTPQYYKGKIDEARVENIAQSAEWIKTEYNNQNDPNSFYNIGKLEKK